MGVFNALVSGSFLPWKRSNRETDYETVLSRLEGEINTVQSRLTQIRLRERRASVTLTLQAFVLWAMYTSVCWFLGLFSLPRTHGWDAEVGWKNARMLSVWLPVLGSPVLILSTRRIVRWWYRRIGAAEDKHLIDLKRQKREKIDEIKRATKYDHLRTLLERYDEAGAKPTIVNARASASASAASTPIKGTNRSMSSSPSSKEDSSANATPQRAPTTPEAQALQAQRMAFMRQQANVVQPPRRSPPAAMVPMQKTWLDKLADAILGADPTVTGPEQKYALICARCHAHNGLALKQEFSEVQYICPHCAHFNSRRPSSAPVGSPFNSNNPGGARGTPRASHQAVHALVDTTPSKLSSTERGSRLKLRADDSDDDDDDDDDEDRPPIATLQESREPISINSEAPDAKEQSTMPLRSRKSHTNTSENSMDMDDD